MRAPALWIGIVAFIGVGCGRIAGIDTYEVSGSAEAVWGCLGKPVSPAGPGPFDVTIEVQPYLASSGAPIGVVEVTLCRLTDPDCIDPETPVGTATDTKGFATLQVRGAFQGFVRITKNDDALPPMERFVPSFYYLNPFINDHQTIRVPFATFQLQDALTRSLGAVQQADRGVLLLNALTCQNQGAAGIDFESEGSDDVTTKWFVVKGAPNTSAIATEAAGYGGFVNVKPGTFAVRAKIDGQTIDTVSVTVRAGTITQTRFVPSGRPPVPPPAPSADAAGPSETPH